MEEFFISGKAGDSFIVLLCIFANLRDHSFDLHFRIVSEIYQ